MRRKRMDRSQKRETLWKNIDRKLYALPVAWRQSHLEDLYCTDWEDWEVQV